MNENGKPMGGAGFGWGENQKCIVEHRNFEKSLSFQSRYPVGSLIYRPIQDRSGKLFMERN